MLGKILSAALGLACLLTYGAPARAATGDHEVVIQHHHDDDGPGRDQGDRCWEHRFDRWGCEALRDCRFDERSGECEEIRGREGGFCRYYDGSVRDCEATPGCYFDFNYGTCLDLSEHPRDRPRDRDGRWRQCDSYSNSPDLCNNQFQCYYDYRYRVCAHR